MEVHHRLSPLFEPRSIAVVGASSREGAFGLRLASAVLGTRFEGTISLINRRGGTVLGKSCLADLSELESPPDLAILGIGGPKLEKTLIDAINAGARSAVVFDACAGETVDGASLLQRLKDIASDADLPICGGNGMGFLNVTSAINASFYPSENLTAGRISLFAHSGSVFTVLAMNDPRFRFDLVASPGQEIGASIDEYIDYAVDRTSTGAIGVFMESARNPDGLIRSLEKARDHGVPVVVCKVGQTEESARLARSHSGALVGSQAAYDAVLKEYGAIAVDSVDALMSTALLCSSGRMPDAGGLACVTDSGGLREMQVDLAEKMDVKLATLSQTTRDALREALPPELEPSNPLDCAGDLTDEFPRVFDRGLDVLANAPEVSMLGFEADMRDDYIYHDEVFSFAQKLAVRTKKPCFFYSSFAQAQNRRIGEELAELGVPCLNGAEITLKAAKSFQDWADRRRAHTSSREEKTIKLVNHDELLTAFQSVRDEGSALALLERTGIPTVKSRICDSRTNAVAAAYDIGFPIALKTAAPGIEHKSDQGGVHLRLGDKTAVEAAYDDLAGRLGPRVIVQRMANPGLELAFGCVVDPDFGPLVMISPGGKLVEFFPDRRYARAPFDVRRGHDLLANLSISRLFEGVRGGPKLDVEAAATALARFSQLCALLGDDLAEADVNPIVVGPDGVTAVDALFVRRPISLGSER